MEPVRIGSRKEGGERRLDSRSTRENSSGTPVPRSRPFIRPSLRPWPRPLAPWAGRITCSFEGCLVQAAPSHGARAFSAVHWVVEECGASETLMRREPPTHPCSLPSMGNSAALWRVASAGLSTCSPYIMPGRGSSSSRWVWTGQTGSVPAVVYPISKDLALLSLPLLPALPSPPPILPKKPM